MTMTVMLTLLVAIGALFTYKISKTLLRAYAAKKSVPDKRIFYIEKVYSTVFVVATLLIVSIVWSVDFKGISVIASSVFAVIGVALFAQWSILSNVTASIIIFFTFPAKVGDRIRIVDGDDTIEGEIVEISLFQVEMTNGDGDTILYPNNQLLQKPVIRIAKTSTTHTQMQSNEKANSDI